MTTFIDHVRVIPGRELAQTLRKEIDTVQAEEAERGFKLLSVHYQTTPVPYGTRILHSALLEFAAS